jgi:hypothetical protein
LINLLLVGSSLHLKAEDPKYSKAAGLSVGVDLSPFIVTAFEPERQGFAFSGRMLFNENWFAIAELGFDRIQFEKDPYDYESNGSFLRLGLDYDFFKVEELGNNDNVFGGIRYGYAVQEHSSPRFIIQDGYWGDYMGRFNPSTVQSHWLEFVFGLRTEVLKNFYMGWSVRMRKVMLVNANSTLEPYVIPGYGRRDNDFNLSFTYTLEYEIPFRKKK